MLGFFSGLRVRVLCLILLAVIPALGFVVYTSLEHQQLVKQNIEEDIIDVTRDIVRFHGQLIHQNRQLLVFLSGVPAVRFVRHQECSEIFSDLIKENEELLNLGLANSQGEIICSALPTRQSTNLTDQPYFQKALQSPQVAVGSYRLNPTTDKPYLGLAKSVRNASGQLKGVIFANLDLAWLPKLMSKDPLPAKGVVAIVDHQGVLLTRWPDPQQWVGVQELEGKIIEIVLSQKQGVSEAAGIDGLSRLYAFQPLDHGSPRGFIFAGVPTRILSEEFSDNFARNLIWLGLAMALALAAAWILSSQFIVQPINILIKTARQLATGNLGVRTDLSEGRGEIHQLAQSLDQMAEGLQQREKNLDIHNNIIVITNQANNVEELLKESIREIANFTNCTAVGIRILQKDGTIPFEASQGFSQKFLNVENCLSQESIDSERDLCIKLIKGAITPGTPYFTKNGSFFVNAASHGVAGMSQEGGISCNCYQNYGYESMALIPLKIKDRIFGLIHVADPQKNLIPVTLVRELEKVAGSLSLALERLWNEENVRGLTHELMKAQEKERLRISRELHDSVAQELSAVKISLDNVMEMLPEKTGKKLNSKIHQISDNLYKALGSVRELAYGLRPPILDSLGLTRALYQLCEEFTTRTGIKVNFLIAGIEEDKLDDNAVITLYRFIQEGLNNVRHHAQAKNVSIKLVSSYPKIILRLEDDGQGFDVIEQQSGTFLEKHMGLLNMQERVALLGGNMQIESQPQKGTHILVEIPWKEVVREPQENLSDR